MGIKKATQPNRKSPIFKKQCGKKKANGLTGIMYCTHDQGHRGDCSWKN